jgi:hypothetical protein
MNIRQLALVFWLCCAHVPFLLAQGQSGPLHLLLDKPHQLRDVVLALQTKNWLITFEESPVLATGELETKVMPTGIAVQVRRTVPVTFDISSNEVSSTSEAARETVLRHLLALYAAAGYSDSYRVIKDGLYLHIVPTVALSEEGKSRYMESILSATVSFPEQRFETLYGLVEKVLNQVSTERSVSVVLGNVPSNIFRQTSVVEVANNESAQEVLTRAFSEINGPRLANGLEPVGLAWTLSYEPTDLNTC